MPFQKDCLQGTPLNYMHLFIGLLDTPCSSHYAHIVSTVVTGAQAEMEVKVKTMAYASSGKKRLILGQFKDFLLVRIGAPAFPSWSTIRCNLGHYGLQRVLPNYNSSFRKALRGHVLFFFTCESS